MTDIYIPIEATDLRKIIPGGEEILYSAYFNGTTLFKNKHYSWASHILITPKGVAFQYPNVYKRKNPIQNEYHAWYNFTLDEGTILLRHFSIFTFKLMKIDKSETKNERKARNVEFLHKFEGYRFDSSMEHLEELRNNPDTKKKELKQYEKYIDSMLKAKEKRKAKEDKNKIKESQ